MNTLAPLIMDDRSSHTEYANNGMAWRAVSDTVMGGISTAKLGITSWQGKDCLHLSGNVSLANNGGFVQARLDLSMAGVLDASAYRGIEIEVWGNGETYNFHLRSNDTHMVWQSYRTRFQALACWQKIQLPFDQFIPHRLDTPLNIRQLRRVGVVAIGKPMQADIYIANLHFYR